MAHSSLLKPLEVLREVPWNFIALPDDAVEGHRSDGFEMLHRGEMYRLGVDSSNRNWRFDRRVRIVPDQLEIFVLKFMNIFYYWIQPHLGQGTGFSYQLKFRLFDMVAVKVKVAKGMNERA